MSVGKQFAPDCKREAVQLLERGSHLASELARELGARCHQQLYGSHREYQSQSGR
ncbi:MAG TPA: hypothetical protein VJU54_06090 [Nitrospiraceae bacterium]|nr:hypothetical protein [Nitrospiraceae bacterium]